MAEEKPRHPAGQERRRSRYRGRRHHPETKPSPAQPPPALLVCCLCRQPIRDPLAAISLGEENAAHFDCVIKKIAQEENVQNRDRVCYLGKGEFGVVRYKGGGGKFEILKRITFENPENAPRWRKDMGRKDLGNFAMEGLKGET
ncbi:MAG: hypothetical protein LBQ61_10555 [Spirochaetales bacterium]|jgi:hypothetical protein|nr:hypothetical protein [Spirochaetales bacterium]